MGRRGSGGTSEHPLLDDELHKYTSGPHPHQLGVVSKSNAKWQPLSLEIPKQLLPSLKASGEGWGLQLLDPEQDGKCRGALQAQSRHLTHIVLQNPHGATGLE